MAIFHLQTKIIGRSEGRSAVACASYRAGEELLDERLGRSFKFRRAERVAHTEIIAPDFAPEWVGDRAKLWNSVEAAEPRKDAQVAREFVVALPNELPIRLQKQILRNWVAEQMTARGLVADIAIHKTPIGDPDQDHAHVMVPPRTILVDGTWNKKKERLETVTERKEQLDQWRAAWAKHCNEALEQGGYAHRKIDHRSNKDRGIDLLPTIHEGYAAQGIEARGGRSWRAEFNRQIHQQNRRILEEIKAAATKAANAVSQAATWLTRGPAESAPKSAPKPDPKPVWKPSPMRPDKLASDPFDLDLSLPAPTPATKKQEPAPAPIVATPQPTRPPDMPPPVVVDVEAEKRKKAAHQAAWRQHGGGGSVGG